MTLSAWSKKILLGEDVKTGEKVYLPPKIRERNMDIIGSPGEGKSRFMEHLIRNDILNNNGGCVIDPHGALYESVVKWCAYKGFLGRKKILLFNPAEDGLVFSFNPLKVTPPTTVDTHVDYVVDAIAKVWGTEDTNRTPLLKKCLATILEILIEKNLSLFEASHLIDPENTVLKECITRDIKNEAVRAQWKSFSELSRAQAHTDSGSAISRLYEFLRSPLIKDIVSQTEQTIDFKKIMDEGYMLLVNLGGQKGKISRSKARLLGSLIVNDLFVTACTRPEGSRPFYLCIDECSRFINEDIGYILTEGRKFGLHLTLAHQNLAQLKTECGDRVYSAVMGSARNKVIFGGVGTEDAEILAEMVFMGELDLEEPKSILDKPTVVGYEKILLKSYSDSHGDVNGGASSRTQQSSSADTTSPEGDPLSSVLAGSDAHTEQSNYSAIDTHTEGVSEALKPILKTLPTATKSLQEQIYRAKAVMINQQTQHAIIKIPHHHSFMVKTPTVSTIASGERNDERVKKFEQGCYKSSDFVLTKKEADKLAAQRILALKQTPVIDVDYKVKKEKGYTSKKPKFAKK